MKVGCLKTALLAIACTLAIGAGAQTAGNNIELIVPFPPGGSVDPIARALQNGMKDSLGGEALVIMNMPGAGGTIGTARVARAAPDGRTIGITTVGPLTTQPHMAKLSYGVDDFTYVCRTHVTPQVLVVPESSPFKTLREFVDFAKANPDKVVMSSTGIGSLPHLAAVEFGQLAGFQWLHVPSKGDSDAARLALGGEITGWVAGVQTYVQLAPRLRALGILQSERNPALPDVATFKEQGYTLNSAGWGGLIVPKGTPAAIVDRLSNACAAATHTPEFEQILRNLRVPQGYLPAAGFAAFVNSEYARYGKLIQATGAASTNK
ncbi:tripartite tricarboxylate transporter substrate binding protein [Rubrivivax albus]|nr:tripartite tricarboxylate transporter substrate binding protein [Rubrivivax albus]MCB1997494.1 tripartite tricarboxylate transporter substrate binding protein [Rhodoferax sp.]